MVFGYQLAGLAAALLISGLINLIARRIFGRFWPHGHVIVLIVISAILAVQATTTITILSHSIFALLFALGIYSGNYLLRSNKGTDWAHTHSARPYRFSVWLGVFILVVQLLYAAFPGYRLDQWTYSLVISRLIHEQGFLAGPIIQDHVFFTGVYEYFFVLPRLIWNNDLFVQCFANAFSWLSVFIPLYGLIQKWGLRLSLHRSWGLLFAAAIMAALPENESIINTKPDFILFASALACLDIFITERSLLPGQGNFIVGFLLAAGIAFKLTWLNFAIATYFAVALLRYRKMLPINLRETLPGLAIGALCTLPYFYKNIYFFGNPVHPLQLGPLSSEYFSDAYAGYWQSVSTRPHGFIEIALTWIRLPLTVLEKSPWVWTIFIGSATLCFTKRNRFNRSHFFNLRPALIILVFFLILWPLFYGTGAYPRFLSPLFAIIISGSIALISRAQINPLFSIVLLLPLVFNSSVEVKLIRMAKGMFSPVDTYFDNAPPPMDLYSDFAALNQHRAANFQNATYLSHNVLSDSYMGYYYDGSVLSVNDFHYEILLRHFKDRSKSECLWDFLAEMNVAYLYSHHTPFDQWSEPYRSNLDRFELIYGSSLEPKAFYVSPSVLSDLASKNCH